MSTNEGAVSKTALYTSGTIALFVWACWLIFLQPVQATSIISNNWEVSLTMLFGSLIAGATSEGGGAIAFPVFTKLLHINPQDAKLFSLAIQSVGMTAAGVAIIAMRIRIEWRVIFWASLGGFAGMLLGSGILAQVLPPATVKMSFTMMATSFAITLFALSRNINLRNERLFLCQGKEKSLLLLAGIAGGTMSGLVGNGIDIITFSLMVLLFRINEKIATPTSVILMAINAIYGTILHYFFIGGFTEQVHQYWLSAVPIVVVGAPLGAIICCLMPRELIVKFLLGLITIELATSLLLIPLTFQVALSSLIIFALFSTVYLWMYHNQSYVYSVEKLHAQKAKLKNIAPGRYNVSKTVRTPRMPVFDIKEDINEGKETSGLFKNRNKIKQNRN